ncbi:MAG: 30S ribosomal protein S4 [Nanoarchaeota archaeon]
MGDIKKIRKKYFRPMHPWNKDRIVREKDLLKEYGLVNKKEIWKMESVLKKFKEQVKTLTSRTGPQAEKERKQVLDRLVRLGMLQPGQTLSDTLSLDAKDVLERRLQTILHRKGYARTAKQARQMIIHRHVLVGDHLMTVPSYLVSVSEQNSIGFVSRSPFFSEDHPERVIATKEAETEKAPVASKMSGNEKILTDEEKEALEISSKLDSGEEKEIETLEQETTDDEVKEIIEEGKTEMGKLEKETKK